MKTLVVYYSLDGNTQLIASAIAQAVGADVLELKPKEAPKSKGFMKYFWGGRQVMMKVKPELLPWDKEPRDYDFLFIGTPVWAFTYTPTLAAFFSKVSLKGKKIALFCCSGGGKGKTIARMAEQLAGNKIVGEIHFVEPLKNEGPRRSQEAKDWAQAMIRL